jgi:hypothetical protein
MNEGREGGREGEREGGREGAGDIPGLAESMIPKPISQP